MCKANVGYEQLCYYLPNLIDTKLVTQDIEDGSVIYRTTDDGREFLNYYFGMMKLIKGDHSKNLLEVTIFGVSKSTENSYKSTRRMSLIHSGRKIM